MGTERIYETDSAQAYAVSRHGQTISRSLFAVVERGDTPLDSGYGEAELCIRIDTVPQDTVATSPDTAAAAATAMLKLSNSDRGHVSFKVEYPAD